MKKKIYLAYGSNLLEEQMQSRCNQAVLIGKTYIQDYALMFKKSKTGYYATIESQKGCEVPAIVWEFTEEDELLMDGYEGYPLQYQKVELEVDVEPFDSPGSSVKLNGLAYVLPEDRELGLPTEQYYQKLKTGYERFSFDQEIIIDALHRSEKNMYANVEFAGKDV